MTKGWWRWIGFGISAACEFLVPVKGEAVVVRFRPLVGIGRNSHQIHFRLSLLGFTGDILQRALIDPLPQQINFAIGKFVPTGRHFGRIIMIDQADQIAVIR